MEIAGTRDARTKKARSPPIATKAKKTRKRGKKSSRRSYSMSLKRLGKISRTNRKT